METNDNFHGNGCEAAAIGVEDADIECKVEEEEVEEALKEFYACSFCQTSFKSTACLQVHVAECISKPYQCNFCGLKYATPETLVYHVASHVKDQALIESELASICEFAIARQTANTSPHPVNVGYRNGYLENDIGTHIVGLHGHHSNETNTSRDDCSENSVVNDEAVNECQEDDRSTCSLRRGTRRRTKLCYNEDVMNSLDEDSLESSGPYNNMREPDTYVTDGVMEAVKTENFSDAEKGGMEAENEVREDHEADPCGEMEKQRRFTCELCLKKFIRKSHLKEHELIVHDGIKQLICDSCGKKFSKSCNLKSHIRAHHVEVDKRDDGEGQRRRPGRVRDCRKGPKKVRVSRVKVAQVENKCSSGLSGAEDALLKGEDIYDELTDEEACDEEKRTQSDDNEMLKEQEETLGSDASTASQSAPSSELDTSIAPHEATDNESDNHEKNELEQVENKTNSSCKKKPYMCSICHKRYKNKQSLWSHEAIHNAAWVQCSLCDKQFKSQSNLHDHLRRAHGKAEINLKCGSCDKSFITESGLKRHEASHRDSFPCQVCSKVFKRNYHLKCHMITHTDERPESCKLCDKSFKNKQTLKSHMKCHVPLNHREVFTCEYCAAQFRQRITLTNHLFIHTGETKPHVCSTCGSSFTIQSMLAQHVRRVHANKDFICEICGRGYKKNYDLKVHMQCQHSDERPYLCSHCGSGFKSQGTLKCHVRKMHINAKRYICEICTKEFPDHYELRMHMDTEHSGRRRPFPCRNCNRRFMDRTSLNKHLKLMHYKDQIFTCDVCQKTFTFRKVFEKHLLIHSSDREFACLICDLRFGRKYHLERHMENRHGLNHGQNTNHEGGNC